MGITVTRSHHAAASSKETSMTDSFKPIPTDHGLPDVRQSGASPQDRPASAAAAASRKPAPSRDADASYRIDVC